MPVYQPLIPTGDLELDVDYQNIQDNFHSLNDTYGKDHLAFSVSGINNGYHTSIHLQQVSAPTGGNPTNYPPVQPPATVGYPQLFQSVIDDGYATDSALFFKTGTLDVLKQLTSNISPTQSTTGKTFLPGGIIVQWGQATTNSSGNATITFTPNFRTFYTAFLTRVEGSDNRGYVQFTAVPTNASGTVKMRNADGVGIAGTFFWVALGK